MGEIASALYRSASQCIYGFRQCYVDRCRGEAEVNPVLA
jgi:hypothetical protein